MFIDLRGSIPTFILITDGKNHDSNALDEINPVANPIYLMDRAYVDLFTLYQYHLAGAYFVIRANDNMKYQVIEQNFNIEQTAGLRADKTIVLAGAKSKNLIPKNCVRWSSTMP